MSADRASTPEEVTYTKAYLEWLSYRIYGYALNETSRLGAPQQQQGIILKHPMNHPLVMPLKFHQRIRERCGEDTSCGYVEALDGSVDSMWQFDFYEFATFSCSPVQCTYVDDRGWHLWVSDLAALAGGLSHTAFSSLPVIWAIVMYIGWRKRDNCDTEPDAGGETLKQAHTESHAPGSQAWGPPPHLLRILCFAAWKFILVALLPCLWHTGYQRRTVRASLGSGAASPKDTVTHAH